MKYLIPAMSLLLIALLGGCAVQKSAARLEAEALYKKGLDIYYYEQPPTEEGLNFSAQAAELFGQAIAADSTYAPAYASLAIPIARATGYKGMSSDERNTMSTWAAEKALELDPDLSMAHVIKGVWQYLGDDGDLEGAEASFKHAIALDPDNCEAHREYALLLQRTGRFEEALVEAERAYDLDPRSLEVYETLGNAYRYLGQYDKAVEMSRKIIKRTPLRSSRYRQLVFTHMMNRKYEEALKVAREVLEIDPDAAANNRYFGWALVKNGMLEEALAAYEKGNGQVGIGRVNALMGRRDEALQVIDDLEQGLEEGQYGTAWNIADIYLGLGENDLALDWLERSCEMRLQQNQFNIAVWGWRLATEEDYDPLRSDPRFQAVVEKTGYKK
ncbi:MAG: tetratricopeptide repeat protein [Calditrichaeota bacterium]|nr:tetratricopeptide repeat protein [Calditrichota bacterium]